MLGFGKRRRVRLNLALQGGGAHGAFTWGVLDRLLDLPGLEIGTVSATSAGAVNAVALASGLATGGRVGAKATLRAVWEAIGRSGIPRFLRFNPLVAGFASLQAMASSGVGPLAGALSPYEFNPFDFNPLRTLLEENVDFAAIRARQPVRLLIAATSVLDGRARLFRDSEITVEAVLASGCLPTIHRAIEIDGISYWDGGFSANPDLVVLAGESAVRDTLLVLLNAVAIAEVPKDGREIAAHINRLTFNAPLLRDVAVIRDALSADGTFAKPQTRRLARHRFHLVEAAEHTATLAPETKMKPDRALLENLHAAGRDEATLWIEKYSKDIGRRGTVDLPMHLLGLSTI
mgnify:CR=1 FL=1